MPMIPPRHCSGAAPRGLPPKGPRGPARDGAGTRGGRVVRRRASHPWCPSGLARRRWSGCRHAWVPVRAHHARSAGAHGARGPGTGAPRRRYEPGAGLRADPERSRTLGAEAGSDRGQRRQSDPASESRAEPRNGPRTESPAGFERAQSRPSPGAFGPRVAQDGAQPRGRPAAPPPLPGPPPVGRGKDPHSLSPAPGARSRRPCRASGRWRRSGRRRARPSRRWT